MVWEFIVVICLVSLVAALTWFFAVAERDFKRDKIRRLGRRQLLEEDEFWREFYAGSGLEKDRAQDILNRVSDALEIPLGLLRPGDRFRVELAPLSNTWGTNDTSHMSMILLTEGLEKELGTRINMKEIETIDDYVRAFSTGKKTSG
jgi:hypothetical protein